MHYTGTIWRPPYEGSSLLLEVTAGCTHHKCKFCTLYADLPFRFKMSPLEDVEHDLLEVQMILNDPQLLAMARLQGVLPKREIQRVFLTGANPFALKAAGYHGLTIGMETGDDQALSFMHKGYQAADNLQQCRRLDQTGIAYAFFYLVGISGAGRGEVGAELTAQVCNRLHPMLIGVNMLTIYPESELYQEMQRGAWAEESELEKYREIRALAQGLTIPTIFAAMGASNPYQFEARFPQDKKRLLAMLDEIIATTPEEELRGYRVQLPHL